MPSVSWLSWKQRREREREADTERENLLEVIQLYSLAELPLSIVFFRIWLMLFLLLLLFAAGKRQKEMTGHEREATWGMTLNRGSLSHTNHAHDSWSVPQPLCHQDVTSSEQVFCHLHCTHNTIKSNNDINIWLKSRLQLHTWSLL